MNKKYLENKVIEMDSRIRYLEHVNNEIRKFAINLTKLCWCIIYFLVGMGFTAILVGSIAEVVDTYNSYSAGIVTGIGIFIIWGLCIIGMYYSIINVDSYEKENRRYEV